MSSEYYTCITISPDGKYVIKGQKMHSCSRDGMITGSVEILDLESGKSLQVCLLDDPVRDIALSQDGKTLIVGGNSGRVHKLTLLYPQ